MKKNQLLRWVNKLRNRRDDEVTRVLKKYNDKWPSKEKMHEIITKYNNLSSLRNALDAGLLSSTEIVMTYVYRAATEGMELNALADIMFEDAIKKATEWDRELKEGKIRGFLHGIPVSFKDQIIIKGTAWTLGVWAMSEQVFYEDGLIAETIRKHGGIPFIKSNLPQLVNLCETTNRIFGTTKNPHNKERSAGGSSGGEGALIASQCSPIGIGTDSAGSIRIPWHFWGTYGFKPTVRRMTQMGVKEIWDWQLTDGIAEIQGTTGPIGRWLDDLVEIMKIFYSKDIFEKDWLIPALPFNSEIYSKIVDLNSNIRLGYFSYDGIFYPCKTVKRSMELTIACCKQIGIEMIEIDPVTEFGYIEGFGKSLFGENRTGILLKNEPHIIEDDISHYIKYIPNFVKKIMIFIMERINMRRETIFLKIMGDPSIEIYSDGILKLRNFSKNFEKIMENNKLDGFICPASATPAFKHFESKEIAMTVLINAVANILDYPSVVIPTTTVTQYDLSEVYDDPYFSNDHFVQETRKSLVNSEGLPVAIQVWTRGYRDEECLGIAKIIDEAIKREKQ